HAAPLLVRSIAEAALDAVERGLADVLIVSGTRTGSPASADDVQRVRAVGPTLIGSGLTPDNAPDLLPCADGAIVGTYFHVDGIIANPVDPGRVDRLVSVVRRLRPSGPGCSCSRRRRAAPAPRRSSPRGGFGLG